MSATNECSLESTKKKKKSKHMATFQETREKLTNKNLEIVLSFCRINEKICKVVITNEVIERIFLFFFAELFIYFEKISKTGQLFSQYTGDKRGRKPHDRTVKVQFDSKPPYCPQKISWGSGSRHIKWLDLQYIAWGHYTPVFACRADILNPHLCFSVVSKHQTLDIQASNKVTTELWVKGLRMLMRQSDKYAVEMSQKHLELDDLPYGGNYVAKKRNGNNKPKTKRMNSLLALQHDLFVMSTTTVFRELDEEKCWQITSQVRELFTPKSLYEVALREDIPWREWKTWVKTKIVTYLRENNLVINNANNRNLNGHGIFSLNNGQ